MGILRRSNAHILLLVVAIVFLTSSSCQAKKRSGHAGHNVSQQVREDDCFLYVPNIWERTGPLYSENSRQDTIVANRLGPMIKGQKAVDVFLNSFANGQLPGNILERATMQKCTLHQSLAGRDIRSMKFLGVTAVRGDFSNNTQGENAEFRDSNLADANLSDSDFERALFSGHASSLKDADLNGTDLKEASFKEVDLSGADMAGATLDNVQFAPHSLPDVSFLAEAQGLESMRSPLNTTALQQVEKQFADLGLSSRARDVEFAVQRSQQELFWYQCKTGKRYAGSPFRDHAVQRRFEACAAATGRAVALDATCEFGRRPWRPLGWILVLGIIWAIALSIGVSRSRRSGISLVFKNRCGKDRSIPIERLIRVTNPPSRRVFVWVAKSLEITLASVFDLPFRGFEIGQWIRLLGKREYAFVLRGRVRSVMGCLTLICFFLLALSILSFLSTSPFA